MAEEEWEEGDRAAEAQAGVVPAEEVPEEAVEDPEVAGRAEVVRAADPVQATVRVVQTHRQPVPQIRRPSPPCQIPKALEFEARIK